MNPISARVLIQVLETHFNLTTGEVAAGKSRLRTVKNAQTIGMHLLKNYTLMGDQSIAETFGLKAARSVGHAEKKIATMGTVFENDIAVIKEAMGI